MSWHAHYPKKIEMLVETLFLPDLLKMGNNQRRMTDARLNNELAELTQQLNILIKSKNKTTQDVRDITFLIGQKTHEKYENEYGCTIDSSLSQLRDHLYYHYRKDVSTQKHF